jgi:hypothetical protein
MMGNSASTTYLEERPMANLWANRARSYYREYRPGEYQAIPDKDTFFRELGETAAAQIDTVYRQLRRPDLTDDQMARMQAEETVRDLIYPPPEPGHEEGWESIVVSTEEYEQAANLHRPPAPSR